jgi:hypothetical protein
MRRLFSLVVFLLFLAFAGAGAQAQTDDSFKDSEIFFLKDRMGIEIRLNTQATLPGNPKDRMQDKAKYRLYEVKNEGDPEMFIQEWTDFLAEPPECFTSDCQIIKLRFVKPLEYDQSFMLAVYCLLNDKPCEVPKDKPDEVPKDKLRKVFKFKVGADAKIVRSLNANDPPSKLRIESKIPIEAPNGEVKLKDERTRFRINEDATKLVAVETEKDPFIATAEQDDDYSVDLDLKRGPAGGRKHKLKTNGGLYEMPGAASGGQQRTVIIAKGEILLPSAPKPEDARVSLSTSATAAVHLRPVFDFVGKIVPFRIWTVRDTKWRWEPTLTADIGLRQTKSANSITVEPLTFIRDFVQEPAEIVDESQSDIPTYTGWLRTPRSRPSNYRLIIGPKAEFDRSFKRKNILGAARVNFEFHRWRGLIANKRAMLENDLGDKAALVEGIESGLDIVPYVAVEAGGHVNNETVAFNESINVFVPRHKIFRSYVGVTAIFEQKLIYLPMTFTFDESLIHLAATESIGYKTDTGVGLRRLRGFHHRSVVTWGIAFDPTKRFNFVVTYENGRKAPNLEYLNKVTAGFKFLY